MIQIVDVGGSYYLFTRWGRVSERGQNACKKMTLDAALKEFDKKYYEKTRNRWGAPFKAVSGQYTHIAMCHENAEEMAAKLSSIDSGKAIKIVTRPSKLRQETQKFISLIFNETVFVEQMKRFLIFFNFY